MKFSVSFKNDDRWSEFKFFSIAYLWMCLVLSSAFKFSVQSRVWRSIGLKKLAPAPLRSQGAAIILEDSNSIIQQHMATLNFKIDHFNGQFDEQLLV